MVDKTEVTITLFPVEGSQQPIESVTKMIKPNTRYVDFTANPTTAAIRLARCWAEGPGQYKCAWVYNWSSGPEYGSRRKTTWSEKRAAVMSRYEEAKKSIAHVQEKNAQRERAERTHGLELRILREERRMLENKPLGVNIRPMVQEIDRKIRSIIDAA